MNQKLKDSAQGRPPAGAAPLQMDLLEEMDLSLLETLDHALNRGLVISGEVTISVANIDLIFLGLNVLIGSVETIERVLETREK